MSTPFDGIDVVYVGVEIFGVLLGVLHGDREPEVVLLALDEDDVFVDNFAGSIQVLHKLNDTAFVEEIVGLAGAFVLYFDPHAAVQEGEFLEAFDKDIVGIFGIRKNLTVGLERRLGTAFVGDSGFANGASCHTAFVRLGPDLAVAAYFDFAPLRQEIHDGDPDAVKSTGCFIGVFFELTAELEDGHYPLESAHFPLHEFGELCVLFDRDTAPVVLDGYGTVGVDGDRDDFRVLCHSLVDGVIYDFVGQMVEAFEGGVPDVHTGAFSNVFQVTEVL